MPFSTPSDMLAWLVQNQFLSPVQVAELEALPNPIQDNTTAAKELIRRGWLTPFQANQILTDKADGLVVGPYRFLERIGEGAMGQVFKAWNVRLGRFGAVKMILKDLMTSTKAKERFRREMETTAQLDHPNIVLVRDAGEADDGRPFIVMDYVEGQPLNKIVKTEGVLPLATACIYLHQAALGLQHAFERNVIHRDVKPGNLMLVRPDPRQLGLVKVMDFGLARWAIDRDESKITQVGHLIGTVDYISPEQAENASSADIRSDIYSLGCTFFYLLLGRPPYHGASVAEKVTARLTQETPQLRVFRPDAPAGLEAMLNRMMARDPAHRFQTPAEVANYLMPFTQANGPAYSAPVKAAPVMARPVMARPVAAAPAAARPAADFPFSNAVEETPAVRQDGRGEADVSFGFGDSTTLPSAGPASPFGEENAGDGEVQQVVANRPKRSAAGLIIGGLFASVLIVIGVVAWIMSGDTITRTGPKYPGGVLTIKPVAPIKAKGGDRKIVIVTVERKGFKGPVTVTLKDVPKNIDVSAKPIVFNEGQTQMELRVFVSYGTATGSFQARLEATAEELKDETPLGVVVTK